MSGIISLFCIYIRNDIYNTYEKFFYLSLTFRENQFLSLELLEKIYFCRFLCFMVFQLRRVCTLALGMACHFDPLVAILKSKLFYLLYWFVKER